VRISTPTSRSTKKRNDGQLAYLGTVTDTDHLAVIELRHLVKPEDVIRLLNAYEIEPGPLINAALGRLQLLIQPDRAKLGSASPEPAEGATLRILPPGTPVPLLAA
jgi:hypothetical protein